ncbi:MAG TPA: polysaccharide deacetylase family protein [Bradyrhizobium sp.]|nr:polysaccharide deacetylase family protein [Bradyrhizobium sp.]
MYLAAAQPASAADCPGNPDAIGTSRTLVVDPRQHPRIGTMQYPETLPLRDHEVVLSFDDGPLPRNSDKILAILASQCVKANFFLIGEMARTYPEGVRKLVEAGHTIGTHSQTHPLTMNRMPIERAKAEIDDGIASVKAALGPDADKSLAPFFRIPGLERATAVEDYLASKGIQVWSADFPADDWRHISSQRVYDLAIQRIEAKGKGILLLHDIQPRTVAALPRILATLKERGYHIVHVVPATPDRPATPTEPQEWQLHPTSENVAIRHWPEVPNFVFSGTEALAVPAWSDFAGASGDLVPQAEPFDRPGRRALAREAWATVPPPSAASTANTLPIPAEAVFQIPELPHPTAETVALLAPPEPRPAGMPASEAILHHGRLERGHGKQAAGPRKPGQPLSRRGAPLKHLVQVKRRSA